MDNYRAHAQAGGQRLGSPPFAKIAIAIIIGLSLNLLFSRSCRQEQYGRIHNALIGTEKKVFAPVRYQQEPSDAQSLHMRAKILIKQGRYREAEIEAQKSLAAKENFYRAYMDLGVVYSSYGDYIKAQIAFKNALEYIGNDTFDLEIIYGDFGLIYLVERRFNEAWEYLRKAYERKVHLGEDFWDDPRLKYVIENDKNQFIKQAENDKRLPGEIFERRKRLDALLGTDNDAVIKDCEQYIEDNPGSVHTYLFRSLLAAALYREGEYEKTRAQLKIIESEKLPDDYIPWVKIMYAYLYEQAGEKQKAIEYLKDIIAHYPEYEAIGQAKEMLERIEGTGSQEGY
jgi:tetratricopeptide (TPR) repeat protein